MEGDKAYDPQTALESDTKGNFTGVLGTTPSSGNFLEGLAEAHESCDIQGDGLLERMGRGCYQPKKVGSGVPDLGFTLSSPRGVKESVTSSWVQHTTNHAEYCQWGEMTWTLVSRVCTTEVVLCCASLVDREAPASPGRVADTHALQFHCRLEPPTGRLPPNHMGSKSCKLHILVDQDMHGWCLCPNGNEVPGWSEADSLVNSDHLSHYLLSFCSLTSSITPLLYP